MLKVNLIVVGKVKEKYFQDAIKEYEKRLKRFCDINIIEVREENFATEPNLAEKQRVLLLEGKEILKKAKGTIIALAIEGKQISSVELASELDKLSLISSEISFVIGGSYGLSDEVKKSASSLLSFSKMTFPHTLFRVMLIEQIYRAFSINANSQYHK